MLKDAGTCRRKLQNFSINELNTGSCEFEPVCEQAVCPLCQFGHEEVEAELIRKIKLREVTINCRAKILNHINEIVRNMNHEGAWDEWINVFPDEATEDDFIDIAGNDGIYEDAIEKFFDVCEEYRRWGFVV